MWIIQDARRHNSKTNQLNRELAAYAWDRLGHYLKPPPPSAGYRSIYT